MAATGCFADAATPMPRVVSSIDLAGLADGTRHELSLEVVSLGDGAELRLPVKVLAGQSARQDVVLIAGTYGDEAEEILALLDLWQAIDPHDLCGRMVIDDLDLSRVFPSHRDGSVTQQLAHVLFHHLVAGADLLLTLHGWYSQGVAEDFIEAGIGGLGRSLPEGRDRYCGHIRALLCRLGMIDAAEPPAGRGALHGARHVLAHAGSLMRLATLLGGELGNGDLLGTIHDLHGRQRYGVHATFVGGVGAHRTFASVRSGDNLFTVFRRLEGAP